MLVDTTLSDKKFSIHSFMSRQLSLGDKVLGTEFVEVPCEVLFNDAERVGGGGRGWAGWGGGWEGGWEGGRGGC